MQRARGKQVSLARKNTKPERWSQAEEIIMTKILTTITFLTLLISCRNTDNLSNKYGKVISDEIIRIEYYEGVNYLNSDSDKKPNSTITDKQKITEIVTEINNASNPRPWKGAQWDKVLMIKKDTTLTYSTNGKVIGINQSSGTFYELNDDKFINRYFEK